MAGWHLRLDIDAEHAAGDLTVTGFATRRTAEELAWVFADALRRHYGPGTVVRATALQPASAP
jgi:hypothetical protein